MLQKRVAHGHAVRGFVWIVVIVALLASMTFSRSAQAAERYKRAETAVSVSAVEQPAPVSDGPPLPLHTIEGVGGLVLTPMAYLVNPGVPGTVVGKPAFALQYAMIGSKDLEVFTATWTFWRRLELGYGISRLGLGDFPADVKSATGVDIGTHDIFLHNLNLRLNVIQEGQWDQGWLPAVTVGAHYKHNEDINGIDRRLGGLLTTLGLDDNDGLDFTLTASKTLTCLPRPTIVSAGARASKAAQLGFLGFTNGYDVTFEGSAVMLVTDRLAVGTEYRQKPDDLGQVSGLIADEDDWWDVHAAYILNDRSVLYATVGNAGSVLNHRSETLFGFVFKHEF